MDDPLFAEVDDAIHRWVHQLRRLVEATGLSQRKIADHPMIPWAHGSIARYVNGRVVGDAWELAVKLVEIAHEQGNNIEPSMPELRHVFMRAAHAYQYAKHAGIDPAGKPAEARDRATEERLPRQLPPPIPNFVGRTEATAALTAVLDASTVDTLTVCVIDGEAGIGKTTVATYWANHVAERFPDGQLYINLHGYSPTERPLDPGNVLETLLRTQGIPPEQIPHGIDSRSALFRSQVAGRRVLMLLDNARDAEQVVPLLPGAGSAVIVTSRNQLRTLVVQNNAHRVTLDLFKPGEGITMLRAMLGPTRVDDEFDATAEIVELCAGLPLALAIFGERAARTSVSLAALAASLQDEYRQLELLDTRDDHSSLSAVLSWSYNALTADARRLFPLLGLHPGPDISLPAAAALTGSPADRTRAALDDLVKIHLVTEHTLGRYRFHDLLRHYAAARANTDLAPEERTCALRRMLGWYLHTAEAAGRILLPRSSLLMPTDPAGSHGAGMDFATRDEALAWCDAEQANLMSAIHTTATIGEPALTWNLASALWGFFYLRKPWTDWIDAYQAGLAAARQVGDEFGQAWTSNGLGVAYWSSRRLHQAIGHYKQALVHWRNIGNSWGEAMTLNNLGAAHNGLSRFQAGISFFHQALRIRHAIGDRLGQAQTLTNLAEAHRECRQYQDAIHRAHEALAIFQEIDNKPLSKATALHSLGAAHRGLEHFDVAIDYYQRALTIRRDIGDKQGQGETLYHLGVTQDAMNNRQQARALFRESLNIFDELNDPQATEVLDRLEHLTP